MMPKYRGAVLISLVLATTGIWTLSLWAGEFTGDKTISLNGQWRFTTDANNEGLDARWFVKGFDRTGWQTVDVPHTWQVMNGLDGYYGVAWYARTVKLDSQTAGKLVKLEFDAVYRDATVWVNGELIGEHKGSGYTPFAFFLDDMDKSKGELEIVVRVDNKFSNQALPYAKSFDWPNDGGIIRSVRLRILPASHIARLLVDAQPNADLTQAKIEVRAAIYSAEDKLGDTTVEATVIDPSGNAVAELSAKPLREKPGIYIARLEGTLKSPQLWHFDKPQLYRLECRLMKGKSIVYKKEAAFGIRKVEVKDGLYYLNGEPMRLMGLEWMPASDPRYGSAESPEFVRQILADMKRLNCIISRFHWQQDDATFEFCDREGMLVQEEVPAWGPQTRLNEVNDIQDMQMREMILAHYNHPSIYAWGLCNEIKGQSSQGRAFIKRGIGEARSLDGYRLLTYASNTLQSNPAKDASALMDFIEWNDYYGSWYGGGLPEVNRNLELICAAFPAKSVVVSEYGLCECSDKNPVGDERRIEILQTHTDCYRKAKCVAGAIFFCYNDYRTHIGDKCTGVFQQRVHGVVDLLGKRKPSWEVLRRETSPIRVLAVTEDKLNRFSIDLQTRSLVNDLPAYTLRNHLLICTAYNEKGQPVDSRSKVLPDLAPGAKYSEKFDVHASGQISRVWVEVFRPTGYSVLNAEWLADNTIKKDTAEEYLR